jgi:phosphoesterase RecJ-like protein
MTEIGKIIDKIRNYETIVIHRHVRPDPDAYGSQAGLKEIITASFPGKQVFAAGMEDPALHFLVRMDEISDKIYQNALVIVCDTANTGRVCDQRYKKGSEIIKIDHHPDVDPYGDIRWVDTKASSTSEMIYILASEGGLQMTDHAARLIYAGIVGDTGRFLFPSATERTFQVAGELVKYNFDRTALYGHLYNEKDQIARLRGYILQHFSLSDSGNSSVRLTKELLASYGVSPAETSKLVGTLGDIDGIVAWVIFIEEEDQIRVRFRSKGPVINGIAAKYHGGGHPMAAGASVYSWNEADQVTEDLEALCKTYTI